MHTHAHSHSRTHKRYASQEFFVNALKCCNSFGIALRQKRSILSLPHFPTIVKGAKRLFLFLGCQTGPATNRTLAHASHADTHESPHTDTNIHTHTHTYHMHHTETPHSCTIPQTHMQAQFCRGVKQNTEIRSLAHTNTHAHTFANTTTPFNIFYNPVY